MKQTETGISQKVIDELCVLAEKYGIKKIILFGSRARGDFHQRSDIDIAVSGGDTVRFALDTDNMTGTLLEYDIVNLDGPVQDELLNEIKKDGKVIYEKV